LVVEPYIEVRVGEFWGDSSPTAVEKVEREGGGENDDEVVRRGGGGAASITIGRGAAVGRGLEGVEQSG
jgi:hypothetical protein